MCFFCMPDSEAPAVSPRSCSVSQAVWHGERVEDVQGLLGHLTEHVFTAGIRLTEALQELPDSPATAVRLEGALDELDRALRDMRTAVFRTCT
jgi:hypothetical protein